MSQIIRLRNWSIHTPSVARARIMPTLMTRRPMIYLQGHNGRDLEIVYSFKEWDRAQKDYEKLAHSIQMCQKALEQVPMVDIPSVPKIQ